MGGMSFFAFCSRPKISSPIKQVAVTNGDPQKHFNGNSKSNEENFQNAKQYSLKELQTATDNFDPENMIGKGGFGAVYKGLLNDGTLAAIKVLSPFSDQGDEEFLKEIEVLSGLDHVNLVKLYGSCTEGTYRMLVYGYLENNSLSQALLGACNDKLQFLWEKRTRICIGLAEGLAFLHEEVKPRIVHRDIKPGNVLLDEDFTPKISDFGLARIVSNSKTHINTRPAGTLGYLAPEYLHSSKLTPKADIYSFGVVLLEIVSGGRGGNMEIHSLVERAWKLSEKGKLVELVDEVLEGDACAEACKYLKIALLCVQERAKERPTMSVVAKMLKGEINVDKIKMPKPGILISHFSQNSSDYQPSLLESCFSMNWFLCISREGKFYAA